MQPATGQAAWQIVLPAALPGVFAAVVLGFGRAMGETMIVLMVCSASVSGHQVTWPITIFPSRVAGPVAAKALQ